MWERWPSQSAAYNSGRDARSSELSLGCLVAQLFRQRFNGHSIHCSVRSVSVPEYMKAGTSNTGSSTSCNHWPKSA
jgi:hypothetical protein